MFSLENKMGGLELLYETPDIDAILKWGIAFYKDKKLYISSPVNGRRYFVSDTKNDSYQYPSIIIQENKRYKVYG